MALMLDRAMQWIQSGALDRHYEEFVRKHGEHETDYRANVLDAVLELHNKSILRYDISADLIDPLNDLQRQANFSEIVKALKWPWNAPVWIEIPTYDQTYKKIHGISPVDINKQGFLLTGYPEECTFSFHGLIEVVGPESSAYAPIYPEDLDQGMLNRIHVDLLAIVIMLSCSNNSPVQQQENIIDSKLQKSRIKKGKQPLLDHINATLKISQVSANTNDASDNSSETVSKKRKHMVRGHYATSKFGKVFWRDAHYRGKGELVTKTTKVLY